MAVQHIVNPEQKMAQIGMKFLDSSEDESTSLEDDLGSLMEEQEEETEKKKSKRGRKPKKEEQETEQE